MSRFTYQQERKLVNYACNRIDIGVPFGKKQVLIYAGQYAKKYDDTFKGGRPWNKWWGGILKRHPHLKLRNAELTAAFSHQGMEREVVKSYFKAIRLTLIKHNMFNKFGAKIWNMDETGIVFDHCLGLGQNLYTVGQVETVKWQQLLQLLMLMEGSL